MNVKSIVIAIAATLAASAPAFAGDTVIYTRSKVDSLIGDSQKDNVVLSQRIGVSKGNFFADLGPGVKFTGKDQDAVVVGQVGFLKKVSNRTLLSLTAEPQYNIDNGNWDARFTGEMVIRLKQSLDWVTSIEQTYIRTGKEGEPDKATLNKRKLT